MPPARRRSRPPAPAPDRGAAAQARGHAATRQAHQSETAEDYAEAIASLIDAGGEARVVDLARRLGVTHVTVIRTIDRLQKAGLVTSEPYRAIFLTPTGRRIADQARKRHELVYRFLRAIGVPDAAAEADAEGIEHHCGKATLAAFARFLARR